MDKRIKEIIKSFDWESVRKTVEALEWSWFDGCSNEVPATGDLVCRATELLQEALERKSEISTGGFTAKYDDGYLTLAFSVSTITVNENGDPW